LIGGRFYLLRGQTYKCTYLLQGRI
jgi:hypothetical protein